MKLLHRIRLACWPHWRRIRSAYRLFRHEARTWFDDDITAETNIREAWDGDPLLREQWLERVEIVLGIRGT